MPFAYVMINTELGSEVEVLKELEAFSEVKETYMVYGIYDILAKIEFADRKELSEVIIKKIRRINNIQSTITLHII